MRRSLPISILLLALVASLALLAAPNSTDSTDPIATNGSTVAPVHIRDRIERAEQLVSEHSYALAREILVELDELDLDAESGRWVTFRLADTLWRSAAASNTSDQTDFQRSREQLEALARETGLEVERDRTWAEVEESLGDFFWTRRNNRNWGQAWPHYEKALRFWAGSSEIDLARARYLGIVWKAASPPRAEPYYYYGYYGNQLPQNVLRDVLRISDDPEDRAHAWYLIAMNLRWQGGEPHRRRTVDAFEAALDAGRGTDWYDDALYHYAEWLGRSGRVVPLEGGGWRQEADFVRALELYRRLTREFREGQTRFRDDALRQIEAISGPQLGLSVSNAFLPGSVVEYNVSWRNLEQIELALYPVDLTQDVRFDETHRAGHWLQQIDVSGRSASRSWSWATNDRGDHAFGQQVLEVEDLPAGAYLFEARAAGKAARDLVLVSDASVVVKTGGERAWVFVCSSTTGAPRPGSRVRILARTRQGNTWSWRALEETVDARGLAQFDLPSSSRETELFVGAIDDDQQAFATANRWVNRSSYESWRVYVHTDRSAYRPTERAQWKAVVRRYDGTSYSTPEGETLRYEITDPRGAKLDEGELTLNRFGSAWGELELGENLPLGEYRIRFHDSTSTIGNAVLFRLEEYKLPEFKVDVQTPTDEGQPRTFRVGDTIEAEILAEYYFGGPVAEAQVEVVVRQRPLYIGLHEPREFPWFYEDIDPRPQWNPTGQIVHRETLTTDAEGRASVRFDSPMNVDADFEYVIEARVTDASRREIVGSGTVRVTRQRYFAFLRSEHYLYRPGDQVSVLARTVDANQRPLRAEGRVRVTRDEWIEVWVNPSGREIRGDKLGQPGWSLKHRGYEREEVLSRVVRTDEDGTAEIAFTAEREGYYRISWSGDENELYPVRSETTVWVGDASSTHLGYRPGGVQIVLDDETARSGQKIPLMLTAPTADSWVLFSVEAEEVLELRVVHLRGTTRFLELDVDERWVPNVFLEAAMVHQAELHLDSRQLIVPPVDHFLEVEVEAGRDEYLPRDEGQLTVRTTDHDGNPVAAEISLALVDESTFYIQEDYAGDPRQFFFGRKRPRRSVIRSTFHEKRYADLDRDDEGGYVDRLNEGRERQERTSPSALGDAVFAKGEVAASRFDNRAKKSMAMDADEALAQAPPTGALMAGAEQPAVHVRSDFRSTVLWRPDVITDDQGIATVRFELPDSLTTWRATARANTRGSRFGIGRGTTRTSKPLIVRLQAPRFFVVGDSATISAVVNNNTDAAQSVAVDLGVAGLDLIGSDTGTIHVPAGGEARVDWRVQATSAGNAELTVTARGAGHSDAMRRDYLVYEHGVEKLLARSGKLRGDQARVTIDLPAARREGSTSMTVQIAPSMAVTLLDALPYLIDYPYGCTEQTMSRFLPAVITMRTLEGLGLRPEQIAGRVFGGIEQAHVDRTHDDGQRDLQELERMVRQGLKRLYDFQHADGGWGWWKQGDSDRFMTAYVVWGLGLARDADIRVDGQVLRRGAEYLDRNLVEAEQWPDLQAFMLHAVSSVREGKGASALQAKAFDNLWSQRDALNAYGRALLALSAHQLDRADAARTLVRNLVNGVRRDDAPDASVVVPGSGSGDATVQGTAHWGEAGFYWRWSDGAVESTSFVLRALLAIDPQNELVEPVTNWMVRNRRGSQWSNTRDTAIAVLSLGEYLKTSGELDSAMSYEVRVNDHTVASEEIRRGDALGAPSLFEVDPSWLIDGANRIDIVRTEGDGALYFSAEATFFSLEEPVTPAGNEIFVERRYEKLVGRPTLLSGYVYEKQPLADRGTIVSGERVEVVLTIEAKNDYEYLVFEDLKPGGLEAVQLKSGEPMRIRELSKSGIERIDDRRDSTDYTGRTRGVHQELRDRKVALFVDKLPQGVWEIRYELRAEVPGAFHALPVLGHAMYVPEIRANGSEVRIDVVDR